MKKDESAVWKKGIMVSPGRYEYKFLVDGQWCNDTKNQESCINCYGTRNNVVVIPSSGLEAPRHDEFRGLEDMNNTC